MDESKELIVISAKSFQKETTWEYLLLDSDTCYVLFQKLLCAPTYLWSAAKTRDLKKQLSRCIQWKVNQSKVKKAISTIISEFTRRMWIC